jgi:hypothetical protein
MKMEAEDAVPRIRRRKFYEGFSTKYNKHFKEDNFSETGSVSVPGRKGWKHLLCWVQYKETTSIAE